MSSTKVCLLAAVAFSAHSAQAGTVIADFNDLNLGPIQELFGAPPAPTGQTPNTGTGFTEPYWSNNTELVLAVDGDLTPPAGSNYVAGQTGDGPIFGEQFRRQGTAPAVAPDRPGGRRGCLAVRVV